MNVSDIPALKCPRHGFTAALWETPY